MRRCAAALAASAALAIGMVAGWCDQNPAASASSSTPTATLATAGPDLSGPGTSTASRSGCGRIQPGVLNNRSSRVVPRGSCHCGSNAHDWAVGGAGWQGAVVAGRAPYHVSVTLHGGAHYRSEPKPCRCRACGRAASSAASRAAGLRLPLLPVAGRRWMSNSLGAECGQGDGDPKGGSADHIGHEMEAKDHHADAHDADGGCRGDQGRADQLVSNPGGTHPEQGDQGEGGDGHVP